jgi:hypothetical protein
LRRDTLVTERLQSAISRRTSRPTTVKGARREIREFYGAVANHSLWFAEGEDRHDGPWIAWFGARGFGAEKTDTLQMLRHRYCPAARRTEVFRADFVATVRLHAVARCLQRNGTLSWAEVKPILADAAAYSVLMQQVAQGASLKQIAVHAGDGLFVGGLDVDEDPYLETYLMLDEALPSRWSPVRTTQLISMVASGLEKRDVYAVAAYENAESWHPAVVTLCERLQNFKWLTGPYDRKLDPLSMAWSLYRAGDEPPQTKW